MRARPRRSIPDAPPREPRNRGGRPLTKYDPTIEYWVTAYAFVGHNDEKIAELLGIGRELYKRWKAQQPGFAAALKKGRHDMSAETAVSMAQLSRGYYVHEDRIIKTKGGEKVVQVNKYVPPNVGAGCFVLKNREKEHWRDRYEMEAGDELKQFMAQWTAAQQRMGLMGGFSGGQAEAPTQTH